MNGSDIIRVLKSDKNLYGECPSCGESFQLAKVEFFYGTRFTPLAKERMEAWSESLKERVKGLRERRKKAKERATKAALSINVGKVIEKIVPVLPGFEYNPQDCRGLFDPIDYILFDGLAERGEVDFIKVIDLKTGGARLNERQRQIRDAIEGKKVKWEEYRRKF